MKLVWRYGTLVFLLSCICLLWKLAQELLEDDRGDALEGGNTEGAPIDISHWLNLTCKQKERVIGVKLCKPQCWSGYFSLPGFEHCEPWLTCDQINTDVHVKEFVGYGAVKQVYVAEWTGYQVAYCNLTVQTYKEDFAHGLNMIKSFASSVHVVQLIGQCDGSAILEYHPLQSLDYLNEILTQDKYKQFDTIIFRFQLSINYVKIIHFLHTSPLGVCVMCDSNDITKTLSQFLVTEDLTLIVSDLDALPQVDTERGNLIKCGHKQLYGDFVAPEQLWPYDDRVFDDNDMPGYDEKTDIWKIPNAVNFILGDVTGSDIMRFHLFRIHRQCKERDPALRPTAEEILHEYEHVYKTISKSK